MSLAMAASIIGIGAGAKTLLSDSGGGGGGSADAYVPTGRGSSDQIWQAILSQLQGRTGAQNDTVDPGINAGYKATQPGGIYGPGGQFDLSSIFNTYGNALRDQGAQGQANQGMLGNAGWQLWQTALDPENALRDRTQQRITDASRAATSSRGIGMSGVSAGIENQDVSNFLMDWNDRQLGRQAQGLQGMTGAFHESQNQANQVGRDLTGSAGLYNSGAMLPFQFANAYTGAMAPGNQNMGALLQAIIPYLNFGNQASQNAFGQQQTGLNNLTSGLGDLGRIFQGGSNLPAPQQRPAPIDDYSIPVGG